MPPPRKINLLPEELRSWLQDELKARGFADYEALAEALNFRLEEEGLELRIGKSAIHAYGQEYAEFAKLNDEASSWASGWMQDNGLQEEAQRHNVLFQMMTTVAFKVLVSMQMRAQEAGDLSRARVGESYLGKSIWLKQSPLGYLLGLEQGQQCGQCRLMRLQREVLHLRKSVSPTRNGSRCAAAQVPGDSH